MSLLLGLVPWWGRILAVVAVLVAAASFGAIKMHQHDEKAYDALQAKFTAFEDGVRVAGLEAKAAAKAHEAADKQRKETADNENSAALATLAADIARLRNARSGRSFLPGAPSCPGGAAGADRYRANIDRALRDFDSEAQKLVDEGSGTTVKMNGAKKWAQSAPGSRK